MESCGPGKPCRRADNASPPAPDDKHADAKANQIFYHTLPCRATFLVVFDEDFFSGQHAQVPVGSSRPFAEPAQPKLARREIYWAAPSTPRVSWSYIAQNTLLTTLFPECTL
jgi:hypothetical protein